MPKSSEPAPKTPKFGCQVVSTRKPRPNLEIAGLGPVRPPGSRSQDQRPRASSAAQRADAEEQAVADPVELLAALA